MTLEEDFRQACKDVDGEVGEYANSMTCNTSNGSMTYDYKDSMAKPSVSVHDEVDSSNRHQVDARLKEPNSFRVTSTGRSLKASGPGGRMTSRGGEPGDE